MLVGLTSLVLKFGHEQQDIFSIFNGTEAMWLVQKKKKD